MRRIVCLVLLFLSFGPAAWAESPWKGTWVERKPPEQGRQTMTVEEAGSGWKLTSQISGPKVPGGALHRRHAARWQRCSRHGSRQADGAINGDQTG